MKFTLLLSPATLWGSAFAVDKTLNPTLYASLKTDATQLDRLDASPPTPIGSTSCTYSPGSAVNANAATFPATAGNGMAMAMLDLGPCAMLPPHYHPRAANFVAAVEGTTNMYMIENGARLAEEILTQGKMTIFPAASCGNATLVSALNSEDAGTHNVANGLLGLPNDLIKAAFGQNPMLMNITAITATIPAVGTGIAIGSADFLAACKAGRTYADS